MGFRNFRANSLLKRALILAIVASNMTFATSPAKANESGSPTNVMAEAHPGKSATISWNAPANETQLGIIEYYIELPGYLVDPNNVALCTVQATVNSAEHSCTVQDLPTNNEPYHNYFFYVVAVDANGRINASYQQSNRVTIYDVPQAPTEPRNITTLPGNNSVKFFWLPPIFDGGSPITSYRVTTVNGPSRSCTTAGTLYCTVTGLNNGQSYNFAVFASNSIGESEAGNLQRSVIPFVGNFDVLDPNSFNNYVNDHQQTRNTPSDNSLFDIGCANTSDTFNFTLKTINTQNSNYSNLKTIYLSDNPSVQEVSCVVFSASGTNGVYITIGNEDGDAFLLYRLNLSTGVATKIALINSNVLGLTQDQFGILRVLILTQGQFPIPVLATAVINSTTGALETPVLVAQDEVASIEIEAESYELFELGELNLANLGLVYSDSAERAVLYLGYAGEMGDGFLVGELDDEESPVRNDSSGAYLTPLNEYLGDGEIDIEEFVFDSNPSIIPNLNLSLRQNIRSGQSYPSFHTYLNRAYLLTGRSQSDRAASLFSLDLASGHLEGLGDFPAFSIPFGSSDVYGERNSFINSTIDSNGVIWNITNGLLQSESIAGFQNVGDYQVSRTEQSDFTAPSTTASIFVAPSSLTAATPSLIINSAPSSPTSVVAETTSKRSATVSFAPSASNGGSVITSYTATSSPGGITKILTQSSGGTFTFDNLQPGTTYTFAVTATNAIGTSVATTSSSIKTMPLEVASISALSFIDDGTGTGGKIVWSGKSIDSVLYTGPVNSYPGPYNYGAFSSGWNGRIRNLEPDKTYTISIFAVSPDGVGETKTLTFKTGASLPTLNDAANSTSMQSATTQISQLIKWVEENTFVPGEAANMSKLLSRFDALETSAHRSYIKVPTSRVSNVDVKSLTPKACSVISASAKVDAGLVTALSGDKCTISYTVTGASKAPATLVKDFFFTKYVK